MIRLRGKTAALAGVLTLAGAGALSAGGTTSCAKAPDSHRFTEILEPDYPSYAQYVDSYIQRRCGTLDCHGQEGRAFRVYGRQGFRLYTVDDGGLVSGGQATSDDEIRANYEAAVALEPEEMSRVMASQGTNPNRLLLLRKPLLLERHKGGPAMAQEDSGYKCVVSWLRVRVIQPAADGSGAFETIPQEQRDQLSAKDDCTDALNNP